MSVKASIIGYLLGNIPGPLHAKNRVAKIAIAAKFHSRLSDKQRTTDTLVNEVIWCAYHVLRSVMVGVRAVRMRHMWISTGIAAEASGSDQRGINLGSR